MRITIRTATRLPRWPAWAVAVVAGWLSVVGAVHVIARETGRAVTLCPLKRLTGVPCPTCGLTRGVDCLLHGDLLAGWLMNPLALTVLGAWLCVLLFRAASGRRIVISSGRGEKIIAICLAAALVLGNWCYLVWRGI